MLKAYKYRLMPTVEQAILIDKHINACRFVYNLALETKNYAYKAHGKNITCYELHRQLTDLKKDHAWLREVDSQALQQAINNMDKAFVNFFLGHNRFPNFKKKCGKQSFKNAHGDWVKIMENKIAVPKFRDGIRFVQDRIFVGQIKSTTISKTATGKYFVSVLVQDGKELPKKNPVTESTALGIDLGLSHFAITSEGIKIENPRHLKKSLSHLKYLQRQASKKKKGGANRKKANYKLALQHEKIVNQRKDFLHKLSSQLIRDNQTLCFEDLNVKGMVRNHNLAQAISDVSWSEFVSMCKYKSDWYGKNLLQASTFYPSTKTCSTCESVNHNLTLKDREWLCATCGTLHDRDINAAKNIKCVGVQRAKSVELPEVFGAMKQKFKVLNSNISDGKNCINHNKVR